MFSGDIKYAFIISKNENPHIQHLYTGFLEKVINYVEQQN